MSTATRSNSMANLTQKDGIYLIRFRCLGKEYKRSLKTRSKTDAEGAKAAVETTIHRLLIDLLQIPAGIDPGDFVLGGGILTAAPSPAATPNLPSTRVLTEEYLKAQEHLLAPSYNYSQAGPAGQSGRTAHQPAVPGARACWKTFARIRQAAGCTQPLRSTKPCAGDE
jgi:hypothetical protein